MSVKKLFVLGFSLVLSTSVSAHSLFLDCAAKGNQVTCKTSFSDGSSAAEFPFEVISYDDDLLVQGQTDQDSSFSFNTPDQDYYILLDAGPGHVIELDMLDIQ